MTIRSEIETRLLAWANVQNPPIRVSLENVPFDKPKNTEKYLEIYFLGSAITSPSLAANRERETGLIQINCCVPLGTGSKVGDDLEQSVRSLFPVIPKIGTVSIERPPYSARALTREDGFRVIPVSIFYRQERLI